MRHYGTGRQQLLFAVALGVVLLLGGSKETVAQEVIEYYGTDHLGSVRVVFNAAGTLTSRADYLPFGEELFTPTGAMPSERFTGQARDGEAGLDYYLARMYQARTGRFNSVDPIFAGLFDPQQWNRYAYTRNNPLRFTDPTGMNLEGEDTGGYCPPEYSHCHDDNDPIGSGFPWTPGYPRMPAPSPEDPAAVDIDVEKLQQTIDNFWIWFAEHGKEIVEGIVLIGTAIGDPSPVGEMKAYQQLAKNPAAVRLLEGGLKHIMDRHSWGSIAKRAGKFLEGTTPEALEEMIKEAAQRGQWAPNTKNRAGALVELDLGRVIGTDQAGNASSKIRVAVRDDGSVITAFPF